jgi:hypothetical protein
MKEELNNIVYTLVFVFVCLNLSNALKQDKNIIGEKNSL